MIHLVLSATSSACVKVILGASSTLTSYFLSYFLFGFVIFFSGFFSSSGFSTTTTGYSSPSGVSFLTASSPSAG